ncbi:MAG TPA: aldose 1-epimerase family protein [Gammaproteobacteria bacterium]|nr:aldose 1-epimerase family protein [Gammaproteobacteria bacterium]
MTSGNKAMPHIQLQNQNLRVQINSFGAEMHSFFDKKRNLEYLWQANPDYWARHAPVLFPIIGRLVDDRLCHQGKTYPLTQHGFARDMMFERHQVNEDSVQFRLHSSQVTLLKFPFDFELIIDYQLYAKQIKISHTIRNPQNTPLPASIGGHPAFNWPLSPEIPKEKHVILFEQEENAAIRQLENGLLLKARFPNPVNQQQLVLKDSLFEKDALIFDQINSHKLTYQATDDLSLTLRFSDFPQLGIWTKPGAGFICLEPWQGYSSPCDFTGEFSQKPGILIIPAHSEIKKTYEISLGGV